MALSVTHPTAAVGTDAGTSKISKNAWNEAHTLSATAGRLVGAPSDSTTVGEITLGSGLSMSGSTLVAGVSGGASTGLMFDTRVQAEASTIDVSIKTLATGGYDDPGDRGHGHYVRRQTEPPDVTNPGYFRSVDRYCLDGTTDATHGGWWALIPQGGLYVEQFGGKADYFITNEVSAISAVNPTPTDNHDAIIYASHYLVSGKSQGLQIAGGTKVLFGYGGYYCSEVLVPERTVCWEGMGNGMYHDVPPSWIVFPAGTAGVVTNSYSEAGFTEESSAISLFRGLFFQSLGHGGQTDKHGFTMDAGCVIEYCGFENFGGDGVNMETTAPDNGAANCFYLQYTWTNVCAGHGFLCQGADSNAGTGIGLTSLFCGGYGIYDNSFLGNTWVGCHTNGNVTGAYYAAGSNNRTVFLGCYSESGQPASYIGENSHLIGGTQGAGVTGVFGSGIWNASTLYASTLGAYGAADEITVNLRRYNNRVLQIVAPDGTEFNTMWQETLGFGTMVGETFTLQSFITDNSNTVTAGRAESIAGGSVVHPSGAFIGNSASNPRFFSTTDVNSQVFFTGFIVPHGTYGKGDVFADYGSTDIGAWGYFCSTAGGVAAAWITGTNYVTSGASGLLTYVKNSSGRFYRCTTKGGGTSTVEPVHTSGTTTGADGYAWKWLTDTTAVFKRTGPTMGQTTVTVSDPILDLSQTWNAGGVTFTGLKANFTSTASAADSLMLDLQIGGASKWKVDKDGDVTQTGSLTIAGAATGITTLNTTGLPTFVSGTAPAAGGTQFVSCSSTAGLGFYFGTGDPTITAGKGSFYSRTDATTTTTRLWVNTDGGTTWTNLTTAA
jgi:hypothetical protein